MAGLWRTPLEVSFLWNGGLRPTTLFQLIYHMVGSQIENSLGLLLSGGAFPPMASLTGKQLEELSSMQLATTKVRDFVDGRDGKIAALLGRRLNLLCYFEVGWEFLG